MRYSSVWFLAITLSSSGCFLGATDGKKAVMDRATFDMGCGTGGLEVQELVNDTYGVTGCGKRATYVLDCTDGWKTDCKAVLNSEETN